MKTKLMKSLMNVDIRYIEYCNITVCCVSVPSIRLSIDKSVNIIMHDAVCKCDVFPQPFWRCLCFCFLLEMLKGSCEQVNCVG